MKTIGQNKNGTFYVRKKLSGVLKEITGKNEVRVEIGLNSSDTTKADAIMKEALYVANSENLSKEVKSSIILNILKIKVTQNATPAPEAPKKAVIKDEKISLSYIISKFIDNKKVNDKLDAKKIKDYEFNLKRIVEITGNCVITDIDFDMVLDIKAKLSALANRNIGKYKFLSFEDYMSARNIPVNERLTITSINKNLIMFKAVLNFFRDEMGNKSFNVPTIKLINDPEKAQLKRKDFNDNELQELFNGDEIENKIARVFGMSGLRNSELMKAKIKDINGNLFFSLSLDDIEVNLKNDASYRLVPVKEIIKNDVIEVIAYVNKASEEAMSKRFIRFIRAKGFSKKHTLYSLRHSFINQLMNNDDIKDSVIKSLVGHQQGDNTFGRYGKDFKGEALINAINKL